MILSMIAFRDWVGVFAHQDHAPEGDHPRHVEDARQPDLEDRRPVARLYQPNQYGELSQGPVGDDVAGIDRERLVRDIR
jgi:hypothetical protein